ncbi:hypothetical protein Nepgr_010719 [Nepenthes gracilis]|uniref:Uncharacterized protein n=1 Tax=Nepenthes gracilis TaxID=150966 RepID=A0AAD3XLL1_NEPGR|nr:hypothetical protein Nepgr_010719 [Nepenthes gracilis]
MANLGGFNENKNNIWLRSENLEKSKWGSQAEGIGAAATARKKKEMKLIEKEVALRIEEPTEHPKKSRQTQVSKSLEAIVEYSSSYDDIVVITPLLKSPRPP